MSTITILPTPPVALPKVRGASEAELKHTYLRIRKRNSSVRKLAAGYRLMAWQSLRKGDAVAATMHAACSRALLDTLR